MRIVFDTSAVNWLLADSDADLLTVGIETLGVLHVTALNILEASQTAASDRREALRKLLYRLWRQRGPLALPNVLLREELHAHSAGKPKTVVGGLPEDYPLARWLSDTDDTGERIRSDFREWSSLVETTYGDLSAQMRSTIFPVFKARPRQYTTADFLHLFWNNQVLPKALASGIAKAFFEVPLSERQTASLLRTRPSWAMYVLAWAYMCYRRGVLTHGFGRAKNAGVFDLWSATYLPLCDYFVTADVAQRKALRYLTVFLPHRPSVLS